MKLKLYLLLLAMPMVATTKAQCDFKITGLTPLDYQVPGTKSFQVSIGNAGTTGLGQVQVFWQQDGGAIQSVMKTPATIKFNGIYGLIEDPAFKVTFPTAGTYQLKAWIKMISPLDVNHANDTQTTTIRVFPTLPKKNVVLEVLKHQGCGPCYDAGIFNDTVVSKNEAYSIAYMYTLSPVHSPLEVLYNADADVVDVFYGWGHPAPMFDRYKFPSQTNIGTLYYSYVAPGDTGYGLNAYGLREQYYEPVQVWFKRASFNESTRELKVTATAWFFDDLNGDYRFNLYLLEDSIKGYQAMAPDPYNHIHNHVVRAMLGGPWGKQGSLPATIKKGDGKDYEFVYTIPADYKIKNLSLTAMVQEYNTDGLKRRILNSKHQPLLQVVSVKDQVKATANIAVYPNPVKDILTVTVDNGKNNTLKLASVSGQVFQTLQATGEAKIDMRSLRSGNYFLYVDDGSVVYTRKIVKE